MSGRQVAIWNEVGKEYSRAARASREGGTPCCPDGNGESSCECGPRYTAEELARVPPEARTTFGSGDPVRWANPKAGETVVDLGSGPGLDAFLAARAVGRTGRVIGIDMTPAMLRRARAVAERYGFRNVEFRRGKIERIPVDSRSADVVVSNCVFNLSPSKRRVFQESFRLLRPGGRVAISDVVRERPLQRRAAACGCVERALLRSDFLRGFRRAGFAEVHLVEDHPYLVTNGKRDASAITVTARRPERPARE